MMRMLVWLAGVVLRRHLQFIEGECLERVDIMKGGMRVIYIVQFCLQKYKCYFDSSLFSLLVVAIMLR